MKNSTTVLRAWERDGFFRRALLLFVLAPALFLLHFGCSETVTPTEETFSPILRVEVYERVPPLGGLRFVDGAEVRLNRIPLSAKQTAGVVATGRTDNQSPAVFTNLDVLISGELYTVLVDAAGRGGVSPEFLMCADTTLRVVLEPPSILSCANLDVNQTLRFFDDQLPPNPELVQNTPAGQERYCLNFPLTAPANQAVRVTLPNDYGNVAPFSLQRVLIDGAPAARPSFDLNPGQSATFQFCVSTTRIGDFNELLPPFEIQCLETGQRGNGRIRLLAEVVAPECDCDRNFEADYDFEQVRVGTQSDISEVVLENTFPCDITIEAPDPFITAPFQLVSPLPTAFPLTLAEGESLSLLVRFAPTQAGEFEQETSLAVITPNGGDDCEIELNLQGIGCNDACPRIAINNSNEYTLDGRTTQDTMSNREDRRVYFYTDAFDRNPNIAVELQPIVDRVMTVKVPDTLCESSTFDISIADGTNDAIDDLALFQVTPRSFTLDPGEERDINIRFTAPRVEEFEQFVEPARAPQDPSDSVFAIVLTLRSAGCVQTDTLRAIVTNCPNFVPLVELVAFKQATLQQPTNLDYQVYYFCEPRSQDAQSDFADLDPANPPIYGDLYVSVPDLNERNPFVEQFPILNIRTAGQDPRLDNADAAFDGFVDVTNNPAFAGVDTPEEFKDVCGQIIPSFCSVAENLNYNLTSIELNFSHLGHIFAFRPVGGGTSGYALIYINRVDDGNTNNARTSSVGFYAIGCIDCSTN